MPFTIRFGNEDDWSTLQVIPPVDHFPVGTPSIGFHNISKKNTVAVEFPDTLVAPPSQLLLRPGERGSVQIASKAPGVYSCNTYVIGSTCPTCRTTFANNSGRFLSTAGTPDPPGEPIIILD